KLVVTPVNNSRPIVDGWGPNIMSSHARPRRPNTRYALPDLRGNPCMCLWSGSIRAGRHLSRQSSSDILWPDLCRILRRGRRGLPKGISITAIRGFRYWMARHQRPRRSIRRGGLWLALVDTGAAFGTVSFLYECLLVVRR